MEQTFCQYRGVFLREVEGGERIIEDISDILSKESMKALAIDRIIKAYNDEENLMAKTQRREAALLPHFSAHHLRHTFCTRLCMTDLSLKEIQDIIGHADINTTMNIYAEVRPDMKKKSSTKMAGKIIINRSDMSINEAIAYDEEDDEE